MFLYRGVYLAHGFTSRFLFYNVVFNLDRAFYIVFLHRGKVSRKTINTKNTLQKSKHQEHVTKNENPHMHVTKRKHHEHVTKKFFLQEKSL